MKSHDPEPPGYGVSPLMNDIVHFRIKEKGRDDETSIDTG
jgi:hypothetical protein